MYKKIFFIGGIIFIGLVFFAGLVLLILSFKNGISFLEEIKIIIVKIVYKIMGFVYDEATIHNPPGDMFPDWIDDYLKSEIKKEI